MDKNLSICVYLVGLCSLYLILTPTDGAVAKKRQRPISPEDLPAHTNSKGNFGSPLSGEGANTIAENTAITTGGYEGTTTNTGGYENMTTNTGGYDGTTTNTGGYENTTTNTDDYEGTTTPIGGYGGTTNPTTSGYEGITTTSESPTTNSSFGNEIGNPNTITTSNTMQQPNFTSSTTTESSLGYNASQGTPQIPYPLSNNYTYDDLAGENEPIVLQGSSSTEITPTSASSSTGITPTSASFSTESTPTSASSSTGITPTSTVAAPLEIVLQIAPQASPQAQDDQADDFNYPSVQYNEYDDDWSDNTDFDEMQQPMETREEIIVDKKIDEVVYPFK